MLLCTPRSTPFPYTTLFRSLYEFEIPVSRNLRRDLLNSFLDRSQIHMFSTKTKSGHRDPPYAPRIAANQDFTLKGSLNANQSDRKSTRLNSSHGYISYAVFC